MRKERKKEEKEKKFKQTNKKTLQKALHSYRELEPRAYREQNAQM